MISSGSDAGFKAESKVQRLRMVNWIGRGRRSKWDASMGFQYEVAAGAKRQRKGYSSSAAKEL